MSISTRVVGAVVAGALLACAGGAGAQATTHPAPRTPRPAPPVFTPPVSVKGTDVLAVHGRAGHDQIVTLRGAHRTLHRGDVVAARPGRHDPSGLLLKVTSVAVRGNATVVHAKRARLAEALPAGTYRQHLELGRGSAAKVQVRQGAGLSPMTNADGKSWSFPFKFGMSCNANLPTKTVTGSLSIHPSVDVDFSVAWHWVGWLYLPYISAAHAHASVTEDASLSAELQGTASCGANLTLARITIPFFVGPVPMTASVDVKVDATASVDGHVVLNANQHLDGTFGVDYTYGQSARTTNTGHSWASVSTPVLFGTGKLEAGLTASTGVQVAGVIGPQINGRGYIGLAYQQPSPHWRTYAGVNVYGTLQLRIPLFNLSIPVWTLQIWKNEWTLATFDSFAPNMKPQSIG